MRVIGIMLAAAISFSFAGSAFASLDGSATAAGEDRFGVTKIYPTKQGGREWFVNMQDPKDGVFDPRTEIIRQPDGSWQVSGNDNGKSQVRMNVYTPQGEEEWQNVEITGYARVVRTIGHDSDDGADLDNVLQWYARSGEKHSQDSPCDGTSIKGRLHLDGRVGWKKEIWHAGGYTEERGERKVTGPLVAEHDEEGRWFGFKVIMYNISGGKAVKMESYIDEHATNEWKKASELVDDGGWQAESGKKFEKEECGRAIDHILAESGPVASFRSDNIVWDFKNLSVREIQPHPEVTSTYTEVSQKVPRGDFSIFPG